MIFSLNILSIQRTLLCFCLATVLFPTSLLSQQNVADTSLKHSLDSMKANFSQRMPADRVALYEQGIAEVASTGVLERALKVGSKAPEFSLPNARGGKTTLSSLLAKNVVVLTFYRGGWCPYCNLQLKALQQRLPDFRAANAMLVAMSPEMPDSSMKTSEKNKLQFEVVSDLGNTIAHQYGVVYSLPERLKANSASRLKSYNGAEGAGELPIAATYVIDTNGMVTYAYVNADYRKPSEILMHLHELARKKIR
jgi:peroxiredoxin